MDLYHYYDKTIGPFRNLSDLPVEEAKKILETIKDQIHKAHKGIIDISNTAGIAKESSSPSSLKKEETSQGQLRIIW